MITFCSSVKTLRHPEPVFHVLANLDRVQQAGGSPVLALDKVTSGPPGLGSRYREVVRMIPFYNGEFISEITAFEAPRLLELTWTGPGMNGRDRYELTEIQDGTRLGHQKWVLCPGPLRIMEPVMREALFPRLEEQLQAIKRGLEEGHDFHDAGNAPIGR
jgi:hypothetical protein